MKRRTGFTLVEVLIVVVILGILAAAVLPKFSNATATARASMLADDLRLMRTQLMVFKGQHWGISAGYPNNDTGQAPTETALIEQVTERRDGFGPYMREMPENPINGKRTVEIIADDANVPSEPDDSHGWIYHPATLTFRADCTGSDAAGKAYFEY